MIRMPCRLGLVLVSAYLMPFVIVDKLAISMDVVNGLLGYCIELQIYHYSTASWVLQ